MRRCLLLISLLLMAVGSFADDYLLPLNGRQQYSMTITARKAEITGICIIKTDGEGSRGAIVNEFGIHALDFVVSADRKKVKLLNVIPAMNRWYVKKVVRKDLKILFLSTQAGKQRAGRVLTHEDDGTITLQNTKFKLKYSLKLLKENNDETAE